MRVTRSTLRQQIADALRDEVLAGRLHPGHEFTVKEIADQYGVSATPVREALFDLSAQGLLDSVQHRGFRVHEFSLADYRAMVEARRLVAEALFQGIAERPPQDLKDAALSVRRRAEEAQRAAGAGDLDVLIGYDLRYWRELSTLFDNPYLSEFLHRMRVQAWVFLVPLLRRDGRREQLWCGHLELAATVEQRDAERARTLVREYYADALALAERLAG